MILELTDFVGKYQISQDINTSEDLSGYLTDNNEKTLLYELMGKSLADLFLADLTGDPSTPASANWITVFNYFNFEDGQIIESCIGIKEYLTARVYDQYVSWQGSVNQASGNGTIQTDATEGEGMFSKDLVFYNRSVDEGRKIQYYLHLNPSDYPDFKGLEIEFRSPI